MIKIIAIGNSFSQDATAYLYDIAKADQEDIKVVNLYIGGCSLETHWHNIVKDEAAYDYELNGQRTDRKISIREALLEEEWDYVTMQQVSNDSGRYDTYFPYITEIQKYISSIVPSAKQLLHQTWAYEMDSNHSAFVHYHQNQKEMYDALSATYARVGKELSLPILPSGDVIQSLRSLSFFDYAKGGKSLCRDGFHMDLVYGRYAVAATWYVTILRRDIFKNSFVPPKVDDEEVQLEIIQLIKETVHKVVETRHFNG